MKANEAPEKVYLSDFTDTTESVFYVKQDSTKKTDIEYTRTDVFIKKACEFLFENYHGEKLSIRMIENVKRYLKGE